MSYATNCLQCGREDEEDGVLLDGDGFCSAECSDAYDNPVPLWAPYNNRWHFYYWTIRSILWAWWWGFEDVELREGEPSFVFREGMSHKLQRLLDKVTLKEKVR
jgi:hypothetical protein